MRPAASTSDPRRRALAAGLALLLAACQPAPELREEQLHVFGTLVDLKIRDGDPVATQAALAEASALLNRYQQEWHPWEPSDLTRINAAFARGEAAPAPDSVHALVERSRPLVAATGGLFDPAVGSLVAAWGFHTSSFPVVSPAPGAHVLEAWREGRPSLASVRREGDALVSDDPKVQLDFGAIAEGVAAEDVVAILRRHGIEHALINMGGDIVARGDAGGRPWDVALRDPFGGVLGTVALADGEALFSTGNYNKFRASPNGGRWGHLLDPRTGLPARGAAAVVVLHADPVLADAAATAVAVAGPSGFEDMARRLRLGCVMMVTDENELMATRGMLARVSLLRQPVPLGEPLDLGPDCVPR